MGQLERFWDQGPKLIILQLCISYCLQNILISEDKVQVFAHSMLVVPNGNLVSWGYSEFKSGPVYCQMSNKQKIKCIVFFPFFFLNTSVSATWKLIILCVTRFWDTEGNIIDNLKDVGNSGELIKNKYVNYTLKNRVPSCLFGCFIVCKMPALVLSQLHKWQCLLWVKWNIMQV